MPSFKRKFPLNRMISNRGQWFPKKGFTKRYSFDLKERFPLKRIASNKTYGYH